MPDSIIDRLEVVKHATVVADTPHGVQQVWQNASVVRWADAVAAVRETDAARQAEVTQLREALAKVTRAHHRMTKPSKLHDPEHLDWTECPALTCSEAAALLAGEAVDGSEDERPAGNNPWWGSEVAHPDPELPPQTGPEYKPEDFG